jgi:hypothetical protein
MALRIHHHHHHLGMRHHQAAAETCSVPLTRQLICQRDSHLLQPAIVELVQVSRLRTLSTA